MTPKAEIHLHIEGAAPPALAARLAREKGVDLDDLIGPKGYNWPDFSGFLAAYDRVAALFGTREDCAALAEAYLREAAGHGALYVEMFVSSDHAERSGLGWAAYRDGLADGIERARLATGIEARMIATCVRHFGPGAALKAAMTVVMDPHPLVTGFGIAGDERAHAFRDFAPAFDCAREGGLELTAHAGEFGGPENVRAALDDLKVSRIGHGVRAIEDPALVDRLAEERIVLEVCPASNLALGVYPDAAAHPLARLARAGVRVTVNTDDPPHFHTDLSRDHALAAEIGLSPADLRQTTRTAIEAAFCDETTRTRLISRLDATDAEA